MTRVRFAPSPTGPLHIGGVRTALYNYLFARKTGGVFILRIEDTDQKRYVEGAEKYILESLDWLGLTPDEGPLHGGEYGPYRQSERQQLYKQYAEELILKGKAYYAFDTPEELEKMRTEQEQQGFHSAKYDSRTRSFMRNSLTMSEDEIQRNLRNSENTVVRLKMPDDQDIAFEDLVRGRVSFNSGELDDKVILKADGMPTYHLANIVDDHLMEITHVIRGEEWLSSTAHHVFMYQSLGWEQPTFAHLPLILKPTGKGKLSKRDGAKFGFPVFPLDWSEGDDFFAGFREAGYDPEALVNFLVLLGWHPGDDREILSINEMSEAFDLKSIVKSGARFDIDKAQWFNQQYIMSYPDKKILDRARSFLPSHIVEKYDDDYLLKVISMMKPRVQTYPDFYKACAYLYSAPDSYDEKQVRKKYDSSVGEHLKNLLALVNDQKSLESAFIQEIVKNYLTQNELKIGIYFALIRIMLCGSMTGPELFDIVELLGKKELNNRWVKALDEFEIIARSS